MKPTMTNGHLEVIYDGDCPVCASWMRMVRLRERVHTVELIDARSGDPRVTALAATGYDLDEGIVLIWNGHVHHGAEAMRLLAILSAEDGWFNHIQRRIFSSPSRARHLYPWLARGRRLLLRLLGRNPVGAGKKLVPPGNRMGGRP